MQWEVIGLFSAETCIERFTSWGRILAAEWRTDYGRAKGEAVVGQESVRVIQGGDVTWHGDSGGENRGSIWSFFG